MNTPSDPHAAAERLRRATAALEWFFIALILAASIALLIAEASTPAGCR